MESVSLLAGRAARATEAEPAEFELGVAALLVGLGADNYIDIFRKKNIGQTTLIELSDEDLVKIGVHDAEIRSKIVEEVKSLPIYDENIKDMNCAEVDALDAIEIGEILTDSAQHLHRLHLSFLANKLALVKTKNIQDCLLHRDMYASDIALITLQEIKSMLNSIENVVNANIKVKQKGKQMEKVLVGVVGCTLVAALATLFIQSLKNL